MKRTGKKNAFVCTLTNILVLKIYQTKTSTIQITTSSIFNILMYKKEKKINHRDRPFWKWDKTFKKFDFRGPK